MPEYKELTPSQGVKYLKKVQNLFIRPLTDNDYYVEPWENQEFRDCSLFKDGFSGQPNRLEIFFLGLPSVLELPVVNPFEEVFLYGAYNQVTVCQMRARGTLSSWKEERGDVVIEKMKRDMRAKILGDWEEDPLNNVAIGRTLSEDERKNRLALIEIGTLLSFSPRSYAYAVYERG